MCKCPGGFIPPLFYSGARQAAILLHCSSSGRGAESAAAAAAAAKTQRARSRDRRPLGPPRTDAQQNLRGHSHACRRARRHQAGLRLLPEAPVVENYSFPPPKKVPAEAKMEGLRADFPSSRLCQAERNSLIPVHLPASCSPANRCKAVSGSLCSCNLTGFTCLDPDMFFLPFQLFPSFKGVKRYMIGFTTKCRSSALQQQLRQNKSDACRALNAPLT